MSDKSIEQLEQLDQLLREDKVNRSRESFFVTMVMSALIIFALIILVLIYSNTPPTIPNAQLPFGTVVTIAGVTGIVIKCEWEFVIVRFKNGTSYSEARFLEKELQVEK
jgi:hypothetical protein